MSTLLRRRFHRVRAGGEAGFSLVLVMGMTGAILGLIAVVTLDATRAMRSGAAHVNYESALSVAEAGIDTTLQTISLQYNAAGAVYVTPGSCALTAPSTFGSEEAERVWAAASLKGLPSTCLRATPAGEFVAVRPTNRQAVYSLGWFPTRANARAKTRLIKAEYLFAPYKPSNAVLTQGSLDFSGSVAVNASLTGAPADVHSNDDVTGINGSTLIEGRVSASGTAGSCGGGVSGGCLSAEPQQSLPAISARSLYTSQSGRFARTAALPTPYNGSWYDLCPDGSMREPSTTPCTGAVLAASGGTNGWTFSAGGGTTPPTWTYPRDSANFPGVYYVYQGNAQLGSNGSQRDLRQMTVIAEAKPTGGLAASCGKLGGNITQKQFSLSPFITGLILVADANLTTESQATAGVGLLIAGDRVDMSTSSGGGDAIVGAVVAANTCAAAGANSIQGISIRFDDTVEAPLTDVIRTSLWLEYPAG